MAKVKDEGGGILSFLLQNNLNSIDSYRQILKYRKTNKKIKKSTCEKFSLQKQVTAVGINDNRVFSMPKYTSVFSHKKVIILHEPFCALNHYGHLSTSINKFPALAVELSWLVLLIRHGFRFELRSEEATNHT